MSSQITAPALPPEHRILRRTEVEVKTGFKRAHIYSLMKEGKFEERLAPAPTALELRLTYIFGFTAVAIGVLLADFIFWALLTGGFH